MAPVVERVCESVGLGEGPHWDIPTQSLLFVECFAKFIVKYDPATKKTTKASAEGKQASFIIPVAGRPNHYVISLDKELKIISWDGESPSFTITEDLAVADQRPGLEQNKFNDAKCDSTGRLWAGTLNINVEDIDKTEAVGTLYSIDSTRVLKPHVDQIRLTNGLAFNDQTKKMFYIDTLKGTVDQFDLDLGSGTISNRTVWFTLKTNNITGGPDGMTIDTDGNLWVAVFGGSCVIKLDGSKPETLLDVVKLPALQITSVAFGGKNLDELYVTSARLPQADGTIPPLPDNGATFRVTGLGVKGLPAFNFKI